MSRLYVWARAGRISFGADDGRTVDVVLLGEPETEGLKLGAPWPPNHDRARTASNLAHGAVTDLKNTVTFPVSFPRMMRVSGERNAVLDSIVAWCQREVPDIHIMRGWLRGSEDPRGTRSRACRTRVCSANPAGCRTPSGRTRPDGHRSITTATEAGAGSS